VRREWSWRVGHDEGRLVCYDRGVAAELQQLFADSLRQAWPMHLRDWQTRPFMARRCDKVARLMMPLQYMEGDGPMTTWYRIQIKEQLDSHWAAWFDGMTIRHTTDGATLLEGPVVDQAALYGLIRKVRDLGLTLIAVQPVVAEQGGAPE
jgi:hypothetical protein